MSDNWTNESLQSPQDPEAVAADPDGEFTVQTRDAAERGDRQHAERATQPAALEPQLDAGVWETHYDLSGRESGADGVRRQPRVERRPPIQRPTGRNLHGVINH
jgi:hypothetical protein